MFEYAKFLVPLLTIFWRNLANLGETIVSYFITERYFEESLYRTVLRYLRKNARLVTPIFERYVVRTVYDPSTMSYVRKIAVVGGRFIWYYKGSIIVAYGGKLTFLRGTFNVSALLKEIENSSDISLSVFCRTLVNRVHGNRFAGLVKAKNNPLTPQDTDGDGFGEPFWFYDWEPPEKIERSSITYSLPQYLIDTFNKLKFFVLGALWYKNHGLVHKMGFLFHGPPGTGKTSFVRYCAEMLNMQLFVMDLASYQNQDFEEQWEKIQNIASMSPCIVLFEDFDAVFKGRENLTDTEYQTGVSFNMIINCIDGVDSSNGVVTIITTNDIDSMDPALIRPNRIGEIVEFKYEVSRTVIDELVNKIMDNYTQEERAEFIAQLPKLLTVAQVKQMCETKAKERFWENAKLGEQHE
jgi:hypothetical protein